MMGFTNEMGAYDFQTTMKTFTERCKTPLWKAGEESQFLSELAIYHGVCAGLAVLTEGILVAPLEGVVSARFIGNRMEAIHSLFLSQGQFVLRVGQDKHFQF